jgi:hypothetical protein
VSDLYYLKVIPYPLFNLEALNDDCEKWYNVIFWEFEIVTFVMLKSLDRIGYWV